MNNTMKYKDYIGSVEFSEEDGIFFGKVMVIRELICYEGEDVVSLLSSFHQAIDEYLAWCEESGRLPERAYKGSFNVRIGQDLHRKIAMYAVEKEISLNGLVETALQEYVVREEQKKYSCSR